MTLTRTIVTLITALLVMLTVVVLRAETTRLQFESSRFDRDAEILLAQFREQQLELARLRNPVLIRDRAADMRLSGKSEPADSPGTKTTATNRTGSAKPAANRKADTGNAPSRTNRKPQSPSSNSKPAKPKNQG